MSPYKVRFSDGGTETALLDVVFATLENLTSQEVETVLRSELEKHKGKTRRDITAQAFCAKRPDDPFGLPLTDFSRTMVYSQKQRKAFTGNELSGKDNEIRETRNSHYRINTVQDYGPKGFKEFMVFQVLFKQPEFAMDTIYAVLLEVAAEWVDVNQDFYLLGLRGERNNPLGWYGVGGGGPPVTVHYDSKKKIFVHEREVIGKTEDGQVIMDPWAGRVRPKSAGAKPPKRKRGEE